MRRRRLIASSLTGLAGAVAVPARAQTMPHGLLPGRLYTGQEIVVALPSARQYRAIERRLSQFRDLTGIRARIVYTDFDRLLNQLRTNLRNKSAGFEVACIEDTWLPHLVGDLVPLDKLMADDGLDLRRYPPAFRAGVIVKGRSYAVPTRGSGQVLFFRKDIFDRARLAAPRTWDELIRAASQLQRGVGIPGLALALGHRPSHTNLHVWLNFVWSRGGELFTEDWRPRFNEQLAIEATQMFAELMLKHEIASPGSGAFSEDDALTAFNNGRAAMVCGWDSSLPRFLPPEGSLRREQIGTTRMPWFDQRPAVTYGRCLALIVNPHSARSNAAWEFVKWATNPELERSIAIDKSDPEASDAMVVHTANFQDPAVNEANGGLPRSVGGSLEYSRILPQLQAWRVVADILSRTVNEVATGIRLALPALDDAARQVAWALRQSGTTRN